MVMRHYLEWRAEERPVRYVELEVQQSAAASGGDTR
jgi:hypothetical protein